MIDSKQIPNAVTMSRLLLAVGAFWFMGEVRELDEIPVGGSRAAFWAFWLFLVASMSDLLDGWLARKYSWLTAFGRVADPVVDKVLTLGSLTYLAASPQYRLPGDFFEVVPVWAVVLMLSREFLVTALRGLVESRGLLFPADGYGKLKLIIQVVYIAIPLGVAGGIPAFLHLDFLAFTREPHLYAALFWVMIGLTLLSGLHYIVRGARMLNAAPSE